MTDIQPRRNYTPPDNLDEIIQAQVESCRERVALQDLEIARRKQKFEDDREAKRNWYTHSPEYRASQIDRLSDVCNQLIKSHPKFGVFRKATVTIHKRICKIHWNGRRPDQQSRLAMVDKEFEEWKIPEVLSRYTDRLFGFGYEEDFDEL